MESADAQPNSVNVGLAAGSLLIAAVGLGALRYIGRPPPEGAIAAIAFAAPFATAASLAFAGARLRRPPLINAAGWALVPLSFVSFAGLTLPLLIPAYVLVREGVRAHRHWNGTGAVVAFVAAPTLVISFWLLLIHDDPATWTSPDGASGGTSDIITTSEAARTLALLALLIVLALGINTNHSRHAPSGCPGRRRSAGGQGERGCARIRPDDRRVR